MNQYLNTDAYDGFPISERDGWKKEMEVSRELMKCRKWKQEEEEEGCGLEAERERGSKYMRESLDE